MIIHYRARHLGPPPLGERAVVTGAMEAEGIADVVEALNNEGKALVKHWTDDDPAAQLRGVFEFSSRIPVKDKMFFFEGLAHMLENHFELPQALETSIDRTANMKLREAVSAIKAMVEDGISLPLAFERRPKDFSRLEIALVKAGSIAGDLPSVLRSIATMLDVSYVTSQRIGLMLTSPVLTAVASLVMIVITLVVVVPQMRQLFTAMTVDIPWYTNAVLALTTGATNPLYWLAGGLFAVIAVIAYRAAMRNEDVADNIQSFYLRIPKIGPMLRDFSQARIARTWWTLSQAKIPLDEAIPQLIPLTNLVPMQRALRRVLEQTKEGVKLSVSFRQETVFDRMFREHVALGSDLGDPGSRMLDVAEFIDRNLLKELDAMVRAVDPIASSVVGLGSSAIMLALVLPYYQLIDHLNGMLGPGGLGR